ncbi:MAG: pentapeptide repeat-containing protein [Bacteroidia bacterium]
MAKKEFYNQNFSSISELEHGAFEACVFKHCSLAETNLEHIDFVECEFISCDLSGALITKSSFKNVVFNDCKLMGVHFDTVNPFLLELSFNNCQLQMSVFYGLKLKETDFINCTLNQADFTEADLTKSVFAKSDLLDAVFDNTRLNEVDFREANHFRINPLSNSMRGALFSKSNIEGLLHSFEITIE